jgi:hypothetical protein
MMASREDHTIELAVNLIRMNDAESVAENLTAALLATAYLLGITPRDIAETLFMGSPEDTDWRENIREKLEADVAGADEGP